MKISQEELNRRLNSSNNLVNRLGSKEVKESKNFKDPKEAKDPRESKDLKESESSKESSRGNDSNNRNSAGRAPELPNAPKSLRLVAATLAQAENNSAQVARNLQLTPGQVTYARETLAEQIKPTEKQVQDLALTRLMDALGLLDTVAIAREKPKDISTIAANLSRVHSNLRSRDERDGNQVNITIYSPKQKTLEDFEVIEVQAAS